MAEAVFQIPVILNSVIIQHLAEFEKMLEESVSTIPAVHEDAEEKHVKDRALQNRLPKIKDAAYGIDDISDECTTEAFRLPSQGQNSGSINKIVNEYNELLASQLEIEKLYFESLLQDVREEKEREIFEAVQKAVTMTKNLHKMRAELNECTQWKKIMDHTHEYLLKEQEIWKEKILEIEEREKKALKLKDKKIQDLEEQLRDLMVCLEAGKTVEQPSMSIQIKDGTVLPIQIESSSRNSNEGTPRSKNRRKTPRSNNRRKRKDGWMVPLA